MNTQNEQYPELRSGGTEGDHDGQHQSVMKKVKAKARKIKDSITKHGHGHHGHEAQPHHDRDHLVEESDDDMEDDAEIHGAPMYESKEVRSYVPGQAGASPIPVAGVGHHGTAPSIQHHAVLGRSQGTGSPVQRDAVQAGAYGVAAAPSAIGHRGTNSPAVGHHGTAPSVQHHAVLEASHGTSSPVQHDAVHASAHGIAAAPSPIGHLGKNLPDSNIGRQEMNVPDSDFGLRREAHNLKDHRSFIPDQLGVSKDDGVTFGGSQTHHDAGGRATAAQPTGHSLASVAAHHHTNLPVSSGMGTGASGVFPHKKLNLDRHAALDTDPNSPTGDGQPHNYQSKATDRAERGCEEIGITPILHSLNKITISDEVIKQEDVKSNRGQQGSLLEPNAGLEDKNRSQPLYSGAGSHDHLSPEPISYPHDKDELNVSYAASVISDKAVQAKNAVASKLGYGEGDHQKTNEPSYSESKGFELEPEKTSSPSSVTDYGKNVASTVYEKVAGAGGVVVGKVFGANEAEHEPVYDKGVSTKEYITEKVSPGEEDKALSEVISGHWQKREDKEEEVLEDEKQAKPKGKVTFSAEVVKQLGGDEEAHQSVEELGSGVSGPAGGGAMVGMIKDTVTSWLGIGGQTDEPSSLVWHDIPKDKNEEADQQDKPEKGRGT